MSGAETGPAAGTRMRVYRPDSRLDESMAAALRHLAGEVWRFRDHIATVFAQDFRAAGAGAGLGVVWNYVLPVVPLGVYLLLGAMRVVPDFDGVSGTAYRAFGITLWFLLAGCVDTPIRTVQARNQEAMKTAFPLSAAIVASFARLAFDTLVRIAVVVPILALTGSWPAWQALALPLLLLPAFAMFIGAGLLLSLLNTLYRDVARVTAICLTYGIFVSGVIFPLPEHELSAAFSLANPFHVFIEASRSLAFAGTLSHPLAYGVTSLIGLALFLVSCRLFYVMEYRVRGIA